MSASKFKLIHSSVGAA